MTHNFSNTQEKYLRYLTGLKTSSISTLVSTLAKQIAEGKIKVESKKENYVLDRVVNVHQDH